MVPDPFVSIILPTYQREKVLCNTISQLLNQDYPNYELIVVDQSATHEPVTEQFIKANSNSLMYLKRDIASLPGARNFGVGHAAGEIILFIDDDVNISTNWVSCHVRHYSDSLIGGVTGRILEDGIPVNNTTDVGRITKWGRVVINRTSSLKTETEWASGGNCSFRKSIIQEVGGFDELFLGNAIFEDADFSFRVRKHGLKIIHDPEAVIWHLAASRGGCDTRALDEVNFYYWFLRNKSRFFKKNFPVYYIPLLLSMNISRAIKVGLLDGRSGHHFHKLIIATIDGLESA